MTEVLTSSQLSKLVPCQMCGRGPKGVPLGEFCPQSDPQDPDFHDFAPRGES